MRIKLQTYLVLEQDVEYLKKHGSIEFTIPDKNTDAFFKELSDVENQLIEKYKQKEVDGQ